MVRFRLGTDIWEISRSVESHGAQSDEPFILVASDGSEAYILERSGDDLRAKPVDGNGRFEAFRIREIRPGVVTFGCYQHVLGETADECSPDVWQQVAVTIQ